MPKQPQTATFFEDEMIKVRNDAVRLGIGFLQVTYRDGQYYHARLDPADVSVSVRKTVSAAGDPQ